MAAAPPCEHVDSDPSGRCASAAAGDCIICLSDDGPPHPVQGGCACRGSAGLAHLACRVTSARHLEEMKDRAVWYECGTCRQEYTGVTALGLARAWQRLAGPLGSTDEHDDALVAAENLATTLSRHEDYAEAEAIQRQVWAAKKEVSGEEHPNALVFAGNLAMTLRSQEKYAEAEAIQRPAWVAQKRVLGEEHQNTLVAATNLAICVRAQGKYAEAEAMQRQVWAAQKRVLGEEHPHTLNSATSVANCLHMQEKYAEAEAMQEQIWGVEKRVLGDEHPLTLSSATNLAISLGEQEKYAEAETVGLEGVQAGAAAPTSCKRPTGEVDPVDHDGEPASPLAAADRSRTGRLAKKQRAGGGS